jgi:Sec-independent protein translocase protein TatA
MGEISITKLLVVAALVVLLFGTKNYVRWAVTWVRLSRALKKP